MYDSLEAAKARGCDVVVIDTAGRLHNKKNLMEELKKINRIIDSKAAESSREILLVLDATTGQNAVSQATLFSETAPITGIVLTKLDGTAKGGIVISIKNELGIPVKLIGVGEKIDDLQPFDSRMFVDALFDLDEAKRKAAEKSEEVSETKEEAIVEEVPETVEESVAEEAPETVEEAVVEEIIEVEEETDGEEIFEIEEEKIVEKIIETTAENAAEEITEAAEEAVSEEVSETEEESVAETVSEKKKKKGFFSRLFGKKGDNDE